jgi:hypothetical protein
MTRLLVLLAFGMLTLFIGGMTADRMVILIGITILLFLLVALRRTGSLSGVGKTTNFIKKNKKSA